MDYPQETLDSLRERGFTRWFSPRGRITHLWAHADHPGVKCRWIPGTRAGMLRVSVRPDDGSINQPPRRFAHLRPRDSD